ncbi:DNA methyltransferase [Ectothiorhodospira shaposhnikovii]|uniref:DNA adenine methylase n=1 Tax=Ectothiorhodospira shaposhnikovii TaxID=1054 RepID=UPI0019086E86|nr:Dam family site-specific DNA-(adenine-N6)-methyltransferase [Ectothiorhodospira shaposhnikovii]MBK1672926.1 DNA methyltransferase [Ectothiorhodospira shaposhnikovii]
MLGEKNIVKRVRMSMTKPFLKWAGGKRWFVYHHANLFPPEFNRYIEPFLGSGAVFFHLAPERAVLGDINADLINTYSAIQKDWRLVYRYLKEHHAHHSPEYYYQIREKQLRSSFSRAAQFIYLNRTCWNGLYRVNLQGVFNVPIGTKSSVVFEDDRFDMVSDKLQGATLVVADFEDLIDTAGEGDFVFVDPPYTVRHNHNAFIKYNEKLFSWLDQVRLVHALKRAKNRGALILGTNAFHQSVRDLYESDFNTMCVRRNSPISSKASTRSKFEELVISTESRDR